MAQTVHLPKSSSLKVTNPRFIDVTNKCLLKFKRYKGPSFFQFS